VESNSEPQDSEPRPTPNLNQSLIKQLSATYQKEIAPEEVFHYVYAILHSNVYRSKFAEFLKSDFPRIPFTDKYEVFKALSNIGAELITLHLLKSKFGSAVKFDIAGSNRVDSIKYKQKKVYINENQFFEGISSKAWNFQIGSYKVLDKWLKSRKNKVLTGEEIEQYIQIVEVINKTIDLMQQIDSINFLDRRVLET